jgi:F-type H+-transporting ATPase subunit b
MLIDWFTVGAQTLNFLILVWLMKRYLYQPILHAIDQREQRIAAELADAYAKEAEAQQIRDEFLQKNAEFDQQRAALFQQASDEANAERLRLFDTARQAADALSAQRQKALRNDAHNLNQSISRRIQQEVFAIARKAFLDLADTSLEERLSEVFIRRLAEMDVQTRQGFAEALETASEPAVVRCAFDLPVQQRATIQNALNESFSSEIKLRYETAPNLIGGIEFSVNGWKLAWSLADYMCSLEKQVSELFTEQSTPPAKPESGDAAKPKNLAKASLAEEGE